MIRPWPALFALLLPVACDHAHAAHDAPSARAAASAVPARQADAPPPARYVDPPHHRARLAHPRSVLLLTVDALRADMPWVGYPRPIAPNLTKLAKQSVVYTHAYALSSYTSMSLGGLMAGRYPSELPRDGHTTSRFYDDATFLAEVLHEAGARTLGVQGHVWFAGDTGIQQGFDVWRVIPYITAKPAREGAVTDDQLSKMMIAALDRNAKKHPEKRFFAWVHFMDPHFKYVHHKGYPRFSGSAYKPGAHVVPPGVRLDEVGQDRRNLYDGELAFTDAQIGKLVAHVRKSPWGRNTAIVITADHGEAFGEHPSYFEHGFRLYDVTTRVPLMFDIPGVKPARIDTRRSHIDLARTLLDLEGVKADPHMRGTSLVPELLGARPPQRDVVIDLPYTDQTPRRRALIHGDDKIIVSQGNPKLELFDLARDPGEQHDLRNSNESLLTDMQRRWHTADAALPDYPAPHRTHVY